MARITAQPISDAVRARLEHADDLPASITDHADAFASLLEKAAQRIRHGVNPQDEATQLLDIIRVAARRT